MERSEEYNRFANPVATRQDNWIDGEGNRK
jgi:hypothetical protein